MIPTQDERARELSEEVWAAATEILTLLESSGVATDSATLIGEESPRDSRLLGSEANQKLYAALDAAYDAMDVVDEERNRPGDSVARDLLLLLLGQVRRELRQAGIVSDAE